MDEFYHLDRFFSVFQSAEVWRAIVEDVNEIRQGAEDGGWLDGKPFPDATYADRIDFDLHRTFAYGNVAAIFQKHLLGRFALPPVTAAELAELARQHLSGAATEAEYESAKLRILSHLAAITFYSTEDINISDSDIQIGSLSLAGEDPIRKLAEECSTVWTSQHGFYIALNPCERFGALTACAWGKVSDGAMKEISKVLARVLPSVSRTLHLANADPSTRDDFDFVPYEVSYSPIAADFAQPKRGFFSTQLTYFFLPQAKKSSSFEQRMRNAVHLLVEADAQTNKAIALSLCFAAIEAMVCDKTEGIIDELSRHVAGMLEPEAMERPAAIRGVKALYNIRSKALHGDALTEDEASLSRSRLLASAVLKAAWEWQNHVTRMGGQPDRNDFLSELRTIATTGQRMVGIPEELRKYLPTST